MTEIKYAGFNARMIAATLDSLIAVLTIAPLVQLLVDAIVPAYDVDILQLSQQSPEQQMQALMHIILYALPGWMLQSFALIFASMACWKFWAATPGKMLMRMKIVDAQTGEPMNDKQILVRGLGYIVSCAVFGLGIFWIGMNKRKQGWHDKMAGTVVVKVPKKTAKSA